MKYRSMLQCFKNKNIIAETQNLLELDSGYMIINITYFK